MSKPLLLERISNWTTSENLMMCPLAPTQLDNLERNLMVVPVAPPLQEKGSAPTGQPDTYPRARTEEETDSVIDQGQWN